MTQSIQPVHSLQGDAETLELYRGPVVLGSDSKADLDGVIWMGWHPSPRTFVNASGSGPEFALSWLRDLHEPTRISLPALGGHGSVFLGGGPAAPSSPTPDQRPELSLTGQLERPFIVGEAVDAAAVIFNVINGPVFIGSALENEDGRSTWAGRVELAAADINITIDQRFDWINVSRDLKWSPGYAFSHVGRLDRSAAGFSPLDALEMLEALSYFLSFVRGASVSAVLPAGTDRHGGVLWQDWASIGQTDPWRAGLSWFDSTLTGGLADLFKGFWNRWSSSSDQQILRYALAFYNAANKPRTLENGLLNANAGLEWMAWVQLVRSGVMSETEFEDQGQRPQTYRRLLDDLNLGYEIPEPLGALRRRGQLGPDAIWRLRKRFAHPRPPQIGTDYEVLIGAWRLAVWYLELFLLRWFGYHGQYGSRLVEGRWQGTTEAVPWAD